MIGSRCDRVLIFGTMTRATDSPTPIGTPPHLSSLHNAEVPCHHLQGAIHPLLLFVMATTRLVAISGRVRFYRFSNVGEFWRKQKQKLDKRAHIHSLSLARRIRGRGGFTEIG